MPDGVPFGNYRLLRPEQIDGRTLDGRSDVFTRASACTLPIAAGTHTISFVNPDLPPQKRTVLVRAGEETRLNLDLK